MKQFSDAKILILGDLILDKYIQGDVLRISPEAPVPVLKAEAEQAVLGGAANVAHNAAMLLANSMLIGTAGNDPYRLELQALLDKLNITYKLHDYDGGTITKVRVVGRRQQIVRIDYEKLIPVDNPVLKACLEDAYKFMQDNKAVVVLSDYGKGVISEQNARAIIAKANELGLITIVDPKGADWSKYTGASIITPNVNELSEVYGKAVPNDDIAILQAGEEIRRKYQLTYLVVTRSERGITLISEDAVKHFPTTAQEVFDVSGAGDTVVATLAAALGGGLDIAEAVELANVAGGIVVAKPGTAPVSYGELVEHFAKRSSDITLTREQAKSWVESLRSEGKKVVFTNGCFDVLHKGHAHYLKEALALGDVLLVGVNSDASVRRLKGEGRPINNEIDRAFLLGALAAVDAVVIFDEDTPLELIKLIKPDVLVKGGDYKIEEVVGREYAGRTVLIPFVCGYSSTGLIDKMRQ